ncbi:hypothetical protein [Occultella aeris]|nr:hypothetical protein [Occultella aeris]
MSDGGGGGEVSRTSMQPGAHRWLAALADSAPRWLARAWVWLSADPIRVLGWVVVGVALVATATWAYTDTIAPCAYGTFGWACAVDPVVPDSPISIESTLIARLDAAFIAQAGQVWAVGGIALGVLAILAAA